MPNTPARVVAIIEDDDGMRRAMNRILEAEGYVTEQYGSAEDFLARNAQARASCVVLDLHLPGMSGLEMMRRLRSESSSAPTVLVTGYDVNLRWDEFTGADCCLVKPFLPESLLQAVERCVSRSPRS